MGFTDYEITVVEKTPYHFMPPLFFDVALGYTTPEKTRAPIKGLESREVKVIQEEAISIDLKNRKVKTTNQSIDYDYLVVSLGTDNGCNAYPGLDKDGYHNYDLDGAVPLIGS
ncbi:MAG: hypothetical protein ACP5LW_04215 [Nitrososphaeria archaeon]